MKKKFIHALIALLSFPISLVIGALVILLFHFNIEWQIITMAIFAIVGIIISATYTHQFVKDFYEL